MLLVACAQYADQMSRPMVELALPYARRGLVLENELFLSSGYHPPPMHQTSRKGGGGTRPLASPTVADRIIQTVVKRYIRGAAHDVR